MSRKRSSTTPNNFSSEDISHLLGESSEDSLEFDDSDIDPDYAQYENDTDSMQSSSSASSNDRENKQISSSTGGMPSTSIENIPTQCHPIADNIIWETVKEPPHMPYNPSKSEGIAPHIADALSGKTPLEYYLHFVDDSVLHLIVEETNRYARKLNSNQESRIIKWTDTTVAEIKKFFGFLMWMGLSRYPTINQYWSKSPLYKNEISSIMSRNRFEVLMKALHFNNDEDRDPNDRLFKVSNLFKTLVRNFQDTYTPRKNFCIDESNIPWRGRLSSKYGVKEFKLCVEGGYLYNLKVYTGKDIARSSSVSETLVLELSEPLLSQGRCLFTDNWYTSVQLATTLMEKQTHLVGTVRSHRKHNAPDVINAKLKKGEKIAQQSSNGITMCKWRDQRDVLMLSTCHTDNMVSVVQRGREIEKPEIVVAYNQCKTYIDLSDQMTSYSPFLPRTIKWYRRVALELLLGSCTVNALVLYNKLNPKISITDFKGAIAMGLLFPPVQRPPPHRPIHHRLVRQQGPVSKVRRVCTRCYEQMRQQHDRKYCQAHAKKVPTKCELCEQFLCLECFNASHT